MRRPNVLIVEDEHIVAAELEERLKMLGYEVIDKVATGPDAIASVRRNAPDIVLMDIRLRGAMDGIETAKQVLAERDMPVVYVTAHSDQVTLDRAKLTGPMGYILKPFNQRDLQVTLEMALYKHSMDRKLREQKQWLAAMLDGIGEGVIATDTERRVTMINPAAVKLTGWPAAEALGRPISVVLNVVHEATRSTVKDPVRTVLDPGAEVESASFSLMILNRQSKALAVDGTVSRIFDPKGAQLGLIFAFRDASARGERAEAAHLTYHAVNQSPDLMLRVGRDGRILDANESAVRYLGYRKEELLKKYLNELDAHISEREWPQWFDMTKREQNITYNTSYVAKDNVALPVQVSAWHVQVLGKEFLFSVAHATTQSERHFGGGERCMARFEGLYAASSGKA